MKTVRDACKQAMAGGKTHLLVGFGLLPRFPALRRKNCGGTIYASSFDTARIESPPSTAATTAT